MSDFLDNPDDDLDGGSRRRAVWGLVVLACVALIIGSLMVLLGGGSGSKNNDANPDLPPLTPSPTGTPTSTAGTGTSSAPTSGATSTTPGSSPRSGDPCPSSAPCDVDGDGGVVAALNIYRAKHGQPAVPGTVTANAQTCALHKGNGSTCVPHYIWTVASAQDGAQAVGKLSAFGQNWLLDPKMSAVSVGWAYVGGSYQCVVLKTLTSD